MDSDQVAAEPQAQTGTEQPGTSNVVDNSSTVPETAAADLLRHAGVPEQVLNALKERAAPPTSGAVASEKPLEETESPGEEEDQPEPDQDAGSDEEPEDGKVAEEDEAIQPEAEADATQESEEPEEDQVPSWFQKRLGKWKRKEERLQDEIDDLKQKLEAQAQKAPEKTPPRQRPLEADSPAFANVRNFEDLETFVEAQRGIRDWCIENPDGVVLNEGQANERVVTPEEVRKTLIGATRIIEAAPRKAAQLQQEAQQAQVRQQWDALSHQEWPELFDAKTEIYQTSQALLNQYPELRRNPGMNFMLGLMLEGWKTFQPRMEAKAKNGQQQQPNGANNGNLPEALKRKIPPIPRTRAPNPPRGSSVPSPIKNAAAAVNRIVKEGATPESVQDAIAAIEKQNAVLGGTKRTAALV